MTVTITIGYTRADRHRDYQPARDGYQPHARQDAVDLDLTALAAATGAAAASLLRPVAARTSPQQWADALLVATNTARHVHDDDPRLSVQLLRAAIDTLPAQTRATIRPLRVGDTVTIAGLTLARTARGWCDLSPENPDQPPPTQPRRDQGR